MNLINRLTGEQALEVLRRLVAREEVFSEAVGKVAKELLSDVDMEDVAGDVFWELDIINVQECWDLANSDYDGYTSPEEAAAMLVEEALQEFVDQINRYHKLGMAMQEQLYCMGVVLGAYRYDQDSESEFKDWCVDIPLEYAAGILGDWRKRTTDKAAISAVNDMIKLHCPKWAKYLIRD